MSGEGKVVCVTGGSGYIASWLIKFLLQRGYTVKATVRDPNDPKKTEFLRGLDGAKERLQLLKANLMEEGAFDSVVDGCDGVFHTASPVLLSTNDPKVDLIEPAVQGTLNVLKSCTKVPSVKRVIITSSMGAVTYNGKPLSPEVVVDESWFSDASYCESKKLWYMLSKTLAEEAAWKFAKEHRIDMITIHPGFVIGPILQPTISLSVEIFRNLIYDIATERVNVKSQDKHIDTDTRQSNILQIDLVNMYGAQTFPNENYRYIDVRDVANAHIQAFEVTSASGRYCLVERVVHIPEVLRILREHYPTLPLPEKCQDDKPLVPKYEVSKAKAKTLGIDFTSLELTVIDTIECLKEKGFLNV